MAKSSGGTGRAGARPGESGNDYIRRRAKELGMSQARFTATQEYSDWYNTVGRVQNQQIARQRRENREKRRAAARKVTIKEREGKYVIAMQREGDYLAASNLTLFDIGSGIAAFPTRAEAVAYAKKYGYEPQ